MIELDTSEPIREIDPAMQRLKDLGPGFMVERGDITPFYNEKSRERMLNRVRVAVDQSPALAPYFQDVLMKDKIAWDFFLGRPEHNTIWWRFKQWLRGKLGMKLLHDSRYHWTDEQRQQDINNRIMVEIDKKLGSMGHGATNENEFATLIGQPDTHDII